MRACVRACVLTVVGWRVLVVDAYDVSVLGWPEGHPLHEQARQLLEQHNPNEVWCV